MRVFNLGSTVSAVTSKKYRNVHILLILLVAAVSGLSLSDDKKTEDQNQNEKEEIVEVLTVNAQEKKFDDFVAVGGIVRPSRVAYSQAYGDGIVTKINFFPGTRVSKGDVILVVEPINPLDGFGVQKIEAKMSGLILKVDVARGETVSKGQSVAMVADQKYATIKFTFTERDMPYLKDVSDIKFSDDQNSLGSVSLKLASFNLMSDEETQSFKGFVDVSCSKSCKDIFGQYQKVNIIRGSEQRLVVPKSVLDWNESTLLVVNSNNKVGKTKVEILQELNKEEVSIAGVTDAANIVLTTNSKKKLKDGQIVVIKQPATAKKETDPSGSETKSAN